MKIPPEHTRESLLPGPGCVLSQVVLEMSHFTYSYESALGLKLYRQGGSFRVFSRQLKLKLEPGVNEKAKRTEIIVHLHFIEESIA